MLELSTQQAWAPPLTLTRGQRLRTLLSECLLHQTEELLLDSQGQLQQGLCVGVLLRVQQGREVTQHSSAGRGSRTRRQLKIPAQSLH